jgi:hypothetical protein
VPGVEGIGGRRHAGRRERDSRGDDRGHGGDSSSRGDRAQAGEHGILSWFGFAAESVRYLRKSPLKARQNWNSRNRRCSSGSPAARFHRSSRPARGWLGSQPLDSVIPIGGPLATRELREIADAVLNLGQPGQLTLSYWNPAIYLDAGYWAELQRRQALLGAPRDLAHLRRERPAVFNGSATEQ